MKSIINVLVLLLTLNLLNFCPKTVYCQVVSSDKIKLKHIKSLQLTSASDGFGARPEIISNGQLFYVVYLGDFTTNRKFKVRIYDSDFNLIKEKALVSFNPQYGSPTDIRVSKDGDYLYAFFEMGSKVSGAHLFAAKYRLDQDFTKIAETINPIAESSYFHDSQDGDELLDDPASVIIEGRPFVMTKIKNSGKGLQNGRTLYVVRELSPDLKSVIQKKDIDLSRVMNGWAYLNNLFYVNGKINHIQPTITSFGPRINFDLALLRFDGQWNFQNNLTMLTDTPIVEGMPTGLRFTDDLLFLTYRTGEAKRVGQGSPTSPGQLWLNIYNHDFQLLESLRLTSGGLAGEHSTVEVVGDNVCAAYGAKRDSDEHENIYVDIFKLK